MFQLNQQNLTRDFSLEIFSSVLLESYSLFLDILEDPYLLPRDLILLNSTLAALMNSKLPLSEMSE